MTVLTACAEASVELSQTEPTTLFSTSDPFARELRLQANRAAVAIAKAYDWQSLMALHTMTGDGTTTSFPLPSDYDRMLLDSHPASSQFLAGYCKVRSMSDWLDLQIWPNTTMQGQWVVLNGAVQFSTALPSGATAKFYYIRNTIVTSAASALQTAFLADADTFNLSERLLALGVVWRWKASKGRDYAEAMQNYEIALAEEVTRDKGSRILTAGRRRWPSGTTIAYPGVLG